MLQIRDVMTRRVISVTPETTLREAADLFARHHISGAPVLAGHSIVGVVSATDLLEFVASNEGERSTGQDRADSGIDERTLEEFDNEAGSLFFRDRRPDDGADEEEEPLAMDDRLRGDLFSDHTVGELMTRDICSLPPEATVSEAAQYMWQAGIHRLLIIDGGQLEGILSMSDLARVAATAT